MIYTVRCYSEEVNKFIKEEICKIHSLLNKYHNFISNNQIKNNYLNIDELNKKRSYMEAYMKENNII